jgi:hypothetical protein
MIADPEGPSFITRTVGRRRYADDASVSHGTDRPLAAAWRDLPKPPLVWGVMFLRIFICAVVLVMMQTAAQARSITPTPGGTSATAGLPKLSNPAGDAARMEKAAQTARLRSHCLWMVRACSPLKVLAEMRSQPGRTASLKVNWRTMMPASSVMTNFRPSAAPPTRMLWLMIWRAATAASILTASRSGKSLPSSIAHKIPPRLMLKKNRGVRQAPFAPETRSVCRGSCLHLRFHTRRGYL